MDNITERVVSRRVALRAVGTLAALSALPSLAACGSSPRQARTAASPALRPLALVGARQDVSVPAAPDLADVVAGLRTFGARLYRASGTVAANWAVSPFSIDLAFGMLRAGARGTTADELDAAFGYPRSRAAQGTPHEAFNALTGTLATTARKATDPIVAISNGLFLDPKFAAQVQRDYLALLASQYGASPIAVQFARPTAAAAINAWVRRRTRGRISKLFDQIDPSTVLLLANAVYLKAAWLNPFPHAMTSPGRFTTATGQPVNAPLMRQTLPELPYAAGPGWQRVTLPYTGGELCMRVVIPTAHASSLGELAPALAAATEPTPRDPASLVDLSLPRWKAATGIDLAPALRSLGVTDLFDRDADLDGIAGGLFVNAAVHRAVITVDEHGTEAAAATGIAVASGAFVGPPIRVRADRPFAWAIVHEPTGTPVFTGHVTDPTGS